MAYSHIRDLAIGNLKAFASLRVRLGRLTVLAGTNSAGKSTVMQALALLEQSRHQDPPGLILNGPLVELGSFEDVLYDRIGDSDDNDVAVSIGLKPRSGPWQHFAGGASSQADFIPLNRRAPASGGALPWEHLTYVRADRIGPTLLHRKSHTAVVRDGDIGARGEYAAHFLLAHGDEAVTSRMCCAGTASTLEAQCAAWLERLAIDTRIYVADVRDTGGATLRFSDGPLTGLSSGRTHLSTNVGFGLSYVLPVIVSCLTSRPGDLVLLENPEAHLHPRAQAVIAELCTRAARAGAQIIVETHSDHVLNGIRLGVATSALKPGDVEVYFFRRGPDASPPIVTRLQLDERGRLEEWPEEFFDEYLNALVRLAEFD